MIVPVIIAGGKGARLWPVSSTILPKPFLSVDDREETMLQATLRRLAALKGIGAPLVVCDQAHGQRARQQAASVFPGEITLLLEPECRGTAPAVCAAALFVERCVGPDATLLVLPADHAIADDLAFANAVTSAAELAQAGYLVTFAVKPSEPATAYGYLKIGDPIDAAKRQFTLEAFVEKPDRKSAERFLGSGQYAWNSGIFMFEAAKIINSFEYFQPRMLAACRSALPEYPSGSTVKLASASFAKTSSISIDCAIMEKAGNGAVVIGDFDWNDMGNWNSVWMETGKDQQGVVARGNATPIDCTGSFIRSDGPVLVGIGLEDMIVVATKDAILVAPRCRAQDVRRVMDELAARGKLEPGE